jgi:hypothetical protein
MAVLLDEHINFKKQTRSPAPCCGVVKMLPPQLFWKEIVKSLAIMKNCGSGFQPRSIRCRQTGSTGQPANRFNKISVRIIKSSAVGAGKEGFKLLDDFLRDFFWQIMTTGQNMTFHGVVRNLTPGVQHVKSAEHQVGIAPKD